MDRDGTGRNGLFFAVVVVVARNTGVAGRRLHVFLLLLSLLEVKVTGVVVVLDTTLRTHTRRNWAELESDGMEWMDGVGGGIYFASYCLPKHTVPYLHMCIPRSHTGKWNGYLLPSSSNSINVIPAA